MWRWCVKSLLSERTTAFTSIAAAAFGLFLVVFFDAVYRGESAQITAYVEHAGADVWVMQAGVNNMHMASSLISDDQLARAGRVSGVAAVEPILYLNTLIRAGDREWFTYVVGLRGGQAMGGPWLMRDGSAEPRPGEAIIPAAMAASEGLGMGDRVELTDRSLRVAGLSEDTFSMANPVVFVHRDDLAEIMSATAWDSYLLVRAESDGDTAALAGRLRDALPDSHVMTTAEFVRSDRVLAAQMGVDLIRLITAIGMALAGVVIAFTVYVHTLSRRRELAVMMALGTRPAAVYLGVVFQASVLMLLATAFTGALSALILPAIDHWVPLVNVQWAPWGLWEVAVQGMLVAWLAALLPTYRVVGIDPLLAFSE